MGSFFQILAFTIGGLILLWLGYRLFFDEFTFLKRAKFNRKNRSKPQACPVCNTILSSGELVETHAYPAWRGSTGRLMHVRGCPFCLQGNRPRQCPVCKNDVDADGYLVSSITENPGHRSHVHVIGCSMCRKGMRQFQLPLS